jgi:hypothetical protein
VTAMPSAANARPAAAITATRRTYAAAMIAEPRGGRPAAGALLLTRMSFQFAFAGVHVLKFVQRGENCLTWHLSVGKLLIGAIESPSGSNEMQ